MALKSEKSETGTRVDPDLKTVRQLIESQSGDVAQDAQGCSDTKRRAERLPTLATTDEMRRPKTAGASQTRLKAVAHGALLRTKSYRPETKRVLWTSLVLMLLLQPFFVFGWSLAIVAAVLAVYWVLGADQFWRRVIDGYEVAEMRAPVLARQAKLRGYVFTKKWNRLLTRLPAGLADQLRVPDLRAILAADAAHDAAMSDRLHRIDSDPATG